MNVAIIGGGACGVMCAIKLKKLNKNLNVTVFEQNDRILKKVLKTGNGKCNILNNLISKEMYNDFRLIEINRNIDVYQELLELGIVLKENTLGRVYPYSESSKTVVNVLLRNLESLGVEVITNCNIVDVKYQNKLYYLNKKKFDVLVIASEVKHLSQVVTNKVGINKYRITDYERYPLSEFEIKRGYTWLWDDVRFYLAHRRFEKKWGNDNFHFF